MPDTSLESRSRRVFSDFFSRLLKTIVWNYMYQLLTKVYCTSSNPCYNPNQQTCIVFTHCCDTKSVKMWINNTHDQHFHLTFRLFNRKYPLQGLDGPAQFTLFSSKSHWERKLSCRFETFFLTVVHPNIFKPAAQESYRISFYVKKLIIALKSVSKHFQPI